MCLPQAVTAMVGPTTLLVGGGLEMFRFVIGALGAAAIALPAGAQVQPFPASFQTQEIATKATIAMVRAFLSST
jgi:hypothetical protein